MTATMGICGKMRSSINFSIFPNFSKDEASPVSSNSMKSKRNFEGEFVGLGIVAAMNEIKGTREAFRSVRATKMVDSDSTQSRPIPIASSKSVVSAAFGGSDCSSESYTCVIYRIGNIGGAVKERERFDVVRYELGTGGGECERKCGVFFESPLKKKTQELREYEMSTSDFLSFCYLCRKKLHGLDIFMYRGDQAFCSVECRCKQILRDERKDSYGASKKSLDCAASPCSAPTLFAAGVAAA
ncbi:hypothetical protein Scep_023109 [Stephania cephalantha]|uniref:FLZ-type domain-containing protein n=1 Tax=Stephania cephalantha TaxID=152367 RepID=A0AAP0EUI2_9MAGN